MESIPRRSTRRATRSRVPSAVSTKIDLNNHNCDGDVKKEKEPKKTPVPLHLFKKPALKDELDMLKSMREKKH